MYGEISGSGWGEQSEFRSDKFYDDTLDSLEKIARENHPILYRIRSYEWSVEEQLAADFLANNKSLESMLEKECEENGEDSKRAQELRAEMNRMESANEIKRLRDKYNEASKAYFDIGFPKTEEEKQLYSLNRQKRSSAERTLRSAIKSAAARCEWHWCERGWYEDWDKDYDFRDDFETFLHEIVFARQNFRKDLFRNDETPELAQKYLENPLWHLPQITNFLLVDLIDSDLIMLEEDFYFGLFAPNIANEIKSLFSEYMPFIAPIHNVSPNLSPKAKAKRRKRRLKTFLIGVGLTYIWRGSLEGERITDLLINQGVPSWIFGVILPIIISYLVFCPIGHIVWEYINKRRIRYHSIYNQAHNLLNIRWDIYSGTYDAKTCIERLKQLDNQDLHISSLIYPLLELQLKK